MQISKDFLEYFYLNLTKWISNEEDSKGIACLQESFAVCPGPLE